MKKAALLLALGLVLAACSSGADAEVATLEDTGTTLEGTSSDQLDIDAEESLLEFAQCMRDNGVPDFPDPEMDADGNPTFFRNGGPGELETDPDTIEAAFEECGELVEGLIRNFIGRDFTELEDTFLEFAQCMRDEGIDMPDPDFSQGLIPRAGSGGIFGDDIDIESPEFEAAAEKCQTVFEGQFGFGGAGRGGDDG